MAAGRDLGAGAAGGGLRSAALTILACATLLVSPLVPGALGDEGSAALLAVPVESIAVVLVLAMGVHFLHAFQVDRQASLLLTRADAATAGGETKDALALRSQYLQLRPKDGAALSKYGALLEQSGNTPDVWRRAYFTFQSALNRDPEREDAGDLRRRMIDLAMKLRID